MSARRPDVSAYRPQLESLEDRTALNATMEPLFGFNGNIASTGDKARFTFQVDASKFTFDDEGKVRLLFQVTREDGSRLDPDSIRFIPASRKNTPSIGESRKDFGGRESSAVVAKFKPGLYEVEIRSERRTTGAFHVEAFLMGDVNNDHQVTAADLAVIKSLNGKRSNQTGYLSAADVTLNGRIDVVDYSWAKNNLGASYRTNGALQFNGEPQYAFIPVQGTLRDTFNSQRFTLEARFQIDQYYGGWFTVVDAGEWTIQVYDESGISFASYNGGTVNFGFIPELGVPYHLALDYNMDRGSIILYVNGEFISEQPYSATLPTPESLLLGINPFGALEYSFGKLDDLRIWSTSRTQVDVQEKIGVELTGNEEGLVGYWKMNEGQGTRFFDQTSNGNHGLFAPAKSDYPTWTAGLLPELMTLLSLR
ncbi:MAG: LamG-like jellyroll fold domain-containing protein [Gemmatales bacterium]